MIQSPGAYVIEKNVNSGQIVAAATAIPAFIGYTQKADDNGRSLKNVPWRVSSMPEFERYFGYDPFVTFNVTETVPTETSLKTSAPVKALSLLGAKNYEVKPARKREQWFLLYWSIALFFENGGGRCYIVSVGTYAGSIAEADLAAGLDLLRRAPEPTMVVIPEAVHLPDETACIGVQQAVLQHCGTMQNRFAILDIYDGFRRRIDLSGDCVASFRSNLRSSYLDYAAAYYPWLNTSIVADKDLSYQNVVSADLTALLKAEAALDPAVIAEITTLTPAYSSRLLNKTLLASSPAFVKIMAEIRKQLNLLPPAAAMAALYSTVDNTAGVWKAPANVFLNAVVSPSVTISNEELEDLDTDSQGKSINAIRSFLLVSSTTDISQDTQQEPTADIPAKSLSPFRPIIGQGVLAWGARTLDGNSPDWRYIQVRRTIIFLEQSFKQAIMAYVFENNDVTTWEKIKTSLRNFLNGIWKQGGLAGNTPDDAFAVSCGLGETMTANDVLEDILSVTVKVAVTAPAEFIEITWQQQMQKP